MHWYRCIRLTPAVLCCALTLTLCLAQDNAPEPETSSAPVIRAETRVVLVDAVVTDKKGEYIRDLTAKNFRIWEDSTEQTITSFSLESDSSKVKQQNHYMVLFFDNTTMSAGDQMQARLAADKFIEAGSSPNRYIAVVNYGGTLQIAQNFTTDSDRLKRAVSGVKMPALNTGDQTIDVSSSGIPGLSGAEMDFAARSGLLALRSMVKTIASLPGRKTLVLLTSGFPVTPEQMPEVTAVINDCNRANVAVYPVDVRGLVADLMPDSIDQDAGFSARPMIQKVSFSTVSRPEQHSGGGGGHSGGGSPGGGTHTPTPVSPGGKGGTTGGNRGGGGGGNTGSTNRNTNPFNQSRLLPPLLNNVSDSQQVMYMLANGTGGFVILNTNDLVSGMQKIANDQNQYYLVGYKPEESEEGKCHSLKVKVDRSGATVRARTGYCNVTPQDLLSGNPVEKDLKKRVSEPASGNGAGSMQAPFFYTAANRARVNFAMDIPATGLKSVKLKKKLHAEMNILGIAMSADGKAAARFSDTIKYDFDDKKEFEEFLTHPIHYENQFSIVPGRYTLNLAFESGRTFGKLELPLNVDPWDGKHFSLSGLAFSTEVHRVSDVTSGLDQELLADRTPLIAQGTEVTPAGSSRLKKSGIGVLYAEIYEPLLVGEVAPRMGVEFRVLDRKTGESKFDTGLFAPPMPDNKQAKNPIVPVGLKIPIETLAPGSYKAELKAKDSVGREATRTAEFEVE